jgi:hypothetical protein
MLNIVIQASGSTQKTSSFVAQKGTMVREADPVSIRGKKLVKVSALMSYLDIPLPVPIQILCRLSSSNDWIYPEFI